MKPGRNDPCPCGSGRKYKKCCLKTEQQAEEEVLAARRREEAFAQMVAKCGEWVARWEGFMEAYERWRVGHVGEEGALWLEERQLEEEDVDMAVVGAWIEECLAEKTVTVNGAEVPLAEVMVGEVRAKGFPRPVRLDTEQRRCLEIIRSSPLRLYLVLEVEPGWRILLRDQWSGEQVQVREHSGSQVLVPGDALAARVMVGLADEPVLTGVSYVSRTMHWQAARELEELRAEGGGERELADIARRAWLSTLVEEWEPPTMVDAGSGDPLALTTVHFDVHDWEEIEARLAEDPDCEGDRDEGWVMLESFDEEEGRVLWMIEASEEHEDRLEIFAASEELAREACDWLELLVDDAVSYRVTEVVDPVEAAELHAARGDAALPPPSLAPETMEEMMRDTYHRLYADFFDEPLGILGDVAPGVAVRTPEGRAAVERLIRDYELGDRRMAEEQGREPIGFDFLWDELERRV